MLARARYGQPAPRRAGPRLAAQAVCALGLMVWLEPLHAGSVTAQLKVSARVVSSCRIGANMVLAGAFVSQPLLDSLSQRVVLTSQCSKHPGSADSMSVSTESRHGSDAQLSVLSRAADGSEILATGTIDEIRTPDLKITRWGIVPMNSRLLVLTGAPSGAGDAVLRVPGVTLLIDY